MNSADLRKKIRRLKQELAEREAEEKRTRKPFNGWANWETWNIALWLNNDAKLYSIAKQYCRQGGKSYKGFVKYANLGRRATPDGARFSNPRLNVKQLDKLFLE